MTNRPWPSLANPSPPLPALAGRARCQALLSSGDEEDAKDRGQEFEEVGGSKCEAMTQLNSARKDLFVRV